MNTHASRRHDLNEMAWIPAVTLSGDRLTLSLRDVLLRSSELDRVAGDTAVETAALLRFLSATAARVVQLGGGRAEIAKAAVEAFVEAHGEQHWLLHPETPFMQEPLLTIPAGPKGAPAATPVSWLELAAPSSTGKAWWGKEGDRTGDVTPAQIARRLVTTWFYSPGVGGRASGTYRDAPDDAWRPRGTISFSSHGMRSFWRGRTLAETLLANVPHAHAARGLPLWLATRNASPSDSELTAATWTGSAYLLVEVGDAIEQVVVSGRRIPGYPADPAKRKALAKEVEAGLWLADPTVMRTPVRKSGEETGELRTLRSISPQATSLRYAAEWWVLTERRGAVRSQTPGLVEVTRSEVFSICLEGQATAPELAHAIWVTQTSALTDATAAARLRSLTTHLVLPLRKAFYAASVAALGTESAPKLSEAVFDEFAERIEPLLGELAAAPSMTAEFAGRFVAEAMPAFMTAVSPYVTPKTLAPHGDNGGIARGRAYLQASCRKALRSPLP